MTLITQFTRRFPRHPFAAAVAGLALVWGGAVAATTRLEAQQAPAALPGLPAPLTTVTLPDPTGLAGIVVDREAAIVLGKALFWDQQVGSDGVTACATCHHHAGADGRVINQINPGSRSLVEGAATRFDMFPTGIWGPNRMLVAEDFPTFRLFDEADRDSDVWFSIDDVVGSAGVFNADTNGLRQRSATEPCSSLPDPVYHLTGLLPTAGAPVNTRQVTPRNAPSAINAAFNLRQFWDGRALPVFNGQSPFGARDVDAGVWEVIPAATKTAKDQLVFNREFRVEGASLASQAVGPVGNAVEMSCLERTFPFVGRKLMGLRPLAQQDIASDDSVLGRFRRVGQGAAGLDLTYKALIERAFAPKYWNSTVRTPDGWTLAEANFSMFFGLSVQLYEMTLISNQTPFDRARWSLTGAVPDFLVNPEAELPEVFDPALSFVDTTGTLSPEAQRGFTLFMTKGRCVACHKGALFTSAAIDALGQTGALTEWMVTADFAAALYDAGFYNIGVRPSIDDVGLGGVDPVAGLPLSISRQLAPTERVAVDGAFKTPGLRNVALTGPYFHNGSRATLAQVMTFYNRGGDRRSYWWDGSDSTGLGTSPSNLHPDIRPLGLTDADMAAIVTFLEEALTDERVRCERAPFDHPSLRLPHGHTSPKLAAGAGRATPTQAGDRFDDLPAIGAGGRSVAGLPGLAPFLGVGTSCATAVGRPSGDRPVNAAPMAGDDAASMAVGDRLRLDVLVNDVDADGVAAIDPATVTVESRPARGLAVRVEAGVLVLTATAKGTYTVTYSVADTAGLRSAAATVTVVVSPRNAAPVAVADKATVSKGRSVWVDVLLNDKDTDGVAGIDGTTLQIQTPPSAGLTAVVSGPGIRVTAAKRAGTYTLKYTVADVAGARSKPAQVTVVVR